MEWVVVLAILIVVVGLGIVVKDAVQHANRKT